MLDKRRKEKFENQGIKESKNPIDLEEMLDFDFYLDDISPLNDDLTEDEILYQEQDDVPLTDVISYRDVMPDSEFADEEEDVQYKDLKEAQVVESPTPKKPSKSQTQIPDEVEETQPMEDEPEYESEDLQEEEFIAKSEDELKVQEEMEGDDNIEVDRSYLPSKNQGSKSKQSKSLDENEDDVTLDADEIANILSEEPDRDFYIEMGEESDEEDVGSSFFDEDVELGDGLEGIEEEESNDEDESVTLSPDELGNITGGEESVVEDEDESVTLSPDELGNITGGEEEGSFFDKEESEDEDESVTLSPDELGNITAEEEQERSFFDEEEEDEDIGLSEEELNEITAEEEVEKSFFDEEDDETVGLSEEELSEIQAEEEEEKSFFDSHEEDEGPIALSSNELENIVNDVTFFDESEGMNEEELSEIIGDEEMTADSLYDDEEAEPLEEEETITLSGDELGNILDSESTDEDEYEYNSNNFEIEEDVSQEDTETSGFTFSTVNKEDVKKLMSYIDELMGSMPEEFVQEFAKSEYFELYKKVMDELDI